MVLGMNGHISKPIEPEKLYATLAQFKVGDGNTRPGPMTSGPLREDAALRSEGIELPSVSGVNVHVGLRHTDGNQTLYMQLLKQFGRDYMTFISATESAIKDLRWDDARRQAHTLRGLAGSLGATELEPLIVGLQAALHAQDRSVASSALTRLESQLLPLVSALRSALHVETIEVRPDIDDSSLWAVETFQPPDWLPRFCDLLRHSDVEAKDLWESRQEEVAQHFPPHLASRISRELERFDFAAALCLVPERS